MKKKVQRISRTQITPSIGVVEYKALIGELFKVWVGVICDSSNNIVEPWRLTHSQCDELQKGK
jgi:hypothetical protein